MSDALHSHPARRDPACITSMKRGFAEHKSSLPTLRLRLLPRIWPTRLRSCAVIDRAYSKNDDVTSRCANPRNAETAEGLDDRLTVVSD